MSLPDLQPGDTLLYFNPKYIFNLATALKTWTLVGHVEIYVGNGMSVASRDGKGVDLYPLRTADLVYVRRPFGPINFEAAMSWFNKPYDPKTGTGVRGQGYDWKGLLCFSLAVKQGSPHHMFCSEFWVNWYRMAGLCVVADDWPADRTAPAQCLQTPALKTIYASKQEVMH